MRRVYEASGLPLRPDDVESRSGRDGSPIQQQSSRVDLSLSKNIDFRERYRLQIRGEATNAFNHSNPNAVAAVETTPSTFGTVTSYRDPRILQLAAKFYF